MALKLKLDPTFWWDVYITVPGKPKPEKIEMEFVYRTRDEYEAFQKEILEAARTKPLEDWELVMRSASGWRGVESDWDESGVKALLNAYPASGQDIAGAYHEALLGSRRGNLRR